MGNTTTAGFAEAVHDGAVSLRAALRAHVTTGFYPQLPIQYADYAAQALALAVTDDADALVVIDPTIGVIPREAVVTPDGDVAVSAATLIRILKLGAFLPY